MRKRFSRQNGGLEHPEYGEEDWRTQLSQWINTGIWVICQWWSTSLKPPDLSHWQHSVIIPLNASTQRLSMRLLVLPSASGQSQIHQASGSPAELWSTLSTQTRKNRKGFQLRGRGWREEVLSSWWDRSSVSQTVKESSKPFVSIVQTKSKTASCLPPYNTVTMESYYVCVFEDFKWK